LRTKTAVLCVVWTARVLGAECPSGMVRVNDTVCIDRYEWVGFNSSAWARPLLALSGLPEPWVGDSPATDVDSACSMRGARVCTLKEWRKACLGDGESEYPYGTKYDATACNTSKLWRAFDEKKVWKRDEVELQRLNQSAPVGSYPRCVSAVGAYDMLGNAEEWVRCDHGRYGWCLVGGFWAKPRTCSEAIVVHSPYWHFYETGVRCCKDVETT